MWLDITTLLNIKKATIKPGLDGAYIKDAWREAILAVYPNAQAHTACDGVFSNILRVRVDDALWVGELEMHKQALTRHLNKKRARAIQKIVFTL
jgi:hypothetical protein